MDGKAKSHNLATITATVLEGRMLNYCYQLLLCCCISHHDDAADTDYHCCPYVTSNSAAGAFDDATYSVATTIIMTTTMGTTVVGRKTTIDFVASLVVILADAETNEASSTVNVGAAIVCRPYSTRIGVVGTAYSMGYRTACLIAWVVHGHHSHTVAGSLAAVVKRFAEDWWSLE